MNNTFKKITSSSTLRAVFSLLLIFVIGLIFNADGAFLKWDTHRDMLRQVSVYGILACGMTIVIIAGGIDLSVGSILGACAVLFSMLAMQKGWSPVSAVVATMLAGVASGAVSGFTVARLSLQPFIATMAMMVFARGIAKFISGGQKISTAIQQADGSYQYVDVPAIYNQISAKIAGDNIAVVTIILIVCLALCWIFLSKTHWGRYLYAIGGNEDAARLAGVPVHRMKIAAYALSGFFCALAGMCQAAQELQGDPEAGMTYELSAIAIVVIGGTNLRCGSGSMGLTALGILTIGYLEKILSINAVGEETRLMLTGVIIVFAVLIQKRKS